MNKKQLIVLGIGILVICGIILAAPKHIYIPYRGTFDVAADPSLTQRYKAEISWDTVFQYTIPVILISGFLIFFLGKHTNFSGIKSHQNPATKPESFKNTQHTKFLPTTPLGWFLVVILAPINILFVALVVFLVYIFLTQKSILSNKLSDADIEILDKIKAAEVLTDEDVVKFDKINQNNVSKF